MPLWSSHGHAWYATRTMEPSIDYRGELPKSSNIIDRRNLAMGIFSSCFRPLDVEQPPVQTPTQSFIVDRPETDDERVGVILEALRRSSGFSSRDVPGLQALLADIAAAGMEKDAQVLSEVETDQTYRRLSGLEDTEKGGLEKFVLGRDAEAAADGFDRSSIELAVPQRAHMSCTGVKL
ncbi:hypothetical protein EJ03DRAFT_186557 [Teratosphaeria nubilosa]|uniref:Uncharacterized protein n=1 Tax=Teratosphaeria nubilosa TaxID=161662 RepID=A0A6G1LIW9_9PEZI|nr:hypothetical protein EJ03DRAFT_186557 [Teratosphaeria nubilosa]